LPWADIKGVGRRVQGSKTASLFSARSLFLSVFSAVIQEFQVACPQPVRLITIGGEGKESSFLVAIAVLLMV
jgi:hypothetical protein